MKKIKEFLDYQTNPVVFVAWWYAKQVRKYVRMFRDPSFQPSRFY